MNRLIFLLSLLLVTAPAWAQRHGEGIFFRWGAFSEESPRRCFAISRPVDISGTRAAASLSVSFAPESRIAGQVHVRLGSPKREGSALLLRIDGRSFQLAGRGADAWAANDAADAAIVAAMRTGVDVAVETRDPNGARYRDRYVLRGAASAIDAAAIACAGKKPQ